MPTGRLRTPGDNMTEASVTSTFTSSGPTNDRIPMVNRRDGHGSDQRRDQRFDQLRETADTEAQLTLLPPGHAPAGHRCSRDREQIGVAH